MDNKGRIDGNYMVKPSDMDLLGLSATSDAEGHTPTKGQLGDPYATAVARSRAPPRRPLGLISPFPVIGLVVEELKGIAMNLGTPVGSPRGSGGVPRLERGRPAAAAAASAGVTRMRAAAEKG